MFFTVDPSSGVAIYLQIVRQIKFAIAERTLRPGQLLPSVRVLAQRLVVNPNTVTRALQELQGEGLVETVRGRGMAVCEGATQVCRRERKAIVADRVTAVLTEALQAGLESGEIRTIVDRRLRALDGKVTKVSDAVPPD